MQLLQAPLESRHGRARGFHDKLALLLALDAPLPPIDRRHGRADVDAGGETLVDDCTRELVRLRSGGRRREDQDNFGHAWSIFTVVLDPQLMYCFGA